MTVAETPTLSPEREAAPPWKASGRWSWAHYLALIGTVLTLYGAWTMIAWALDGGASSITAFRDRDDPSWVAARVYEAGSILVGVLVGQWVVRGCLKARRLTFEAMFCIAGFTTIWWDPVGNFAGQHFTYSANWVNVRSWCGSMPGVVNPDCGRMPEAVLFASFIYTFGILAFVIVLNRLMGFFKRRFPSISTAKLLLLTLGAGMFVDFVFEAPAILLDLWSFPGSPSWMSALGDRHRWHILEIFSGALYFVSLAAVRFFKDDSGLTVVERGLSGMAPRRRTIVSVMALSGVSQIFIFVNVLFVNIAGVYTDHYPEIPMHLNNALCDGPGVTGTRYGPCPGAPDFRLPILELPGEEYEDDPDVVVDPESE